MTMKIYTKTGDQGETGLWGGARVPKHHPRVEAYGAIDELNCALGFALASMAGEPSLAELLEELRRIQSDLFILGTFLASPPDKRSTLPAALRSGLGEEKTAALERSIDRMTAELKPLQRFILPGGSIPGAALHLARGAARRAEREACRLAQDGGGEARAIVYLNRLSDYLFTAARWANAKGGAAETEWEAPR
jgi:cob(I)alamin adenosyltransferase